MIRLRHLVEMAVKGARAIIMSMNILTKRIFTNNSHCVFKVTARPINSEKASTQEEYV